ncbi:hypothetical protein O6H91_07G056900 [Diphasiastrum complanatum]|uniref:Uncharacterized protein n=1 Tax=Diphasiastrum complanatum TaxID=34168 RepID=A0ACC2D5M4_DIPCM|nr:hypothetical protein O6H91_Y365300 [Diphasiastrum complanatum]KAJ7549517.1 hypothetical protein O6H91_07G056900 [Diphasiastrum complanatum]
MATEEMQAESSDAALLDFLSSLADYTPTIPDELAEHYLSSSGFQCPDIRVTRLVSVATQKFIAEIAADALQYCKMRQSVSSKERKERGPSVKEKKLVMTTEDLATALREYGVNFKRQEYFADSPSAGINLPSKDKGDE